MILTPFLGHDVFEVVGNQLTSRGIFHRVLNLRYGPQVLGSVPDDLLNVLIDVRELVQNQLKGFSVVFEHVHVRLGMVVVLDCGFHKNSVVIDHLPCFKVPIGRYVFDHSVHYEVDGFRVSPLFGDYVAFNKPLGLELLKVLGIEVVVSVVEEADDLYCVLVEELSELGFERGGQDFK